jgi:hypothetical protein
MPQYMPKMVTLQHIHRYNPVHSHPLILYGVFILDYECTIPHSLGIINQLFLAISFQSVHPYEYIVLPVPPFVEKFAITVIVVSLAITAITLRVYFRVVKRGFTFNGKSVIVAILLQQ